MDYSLGRGENSDGQVEMDDEALVQAARKNKTAFTPLYRRYAERVYRYIYFRVGNAVEAEDLTAQVFADAIAALSKYRSQGRFSGWLFTLAYRRCADYYRQPVAEPLSEQLRAGVSQDPADQTLQREKFNRLEQILYKLGDEERELLRLHYAAGLTYREIADVLGCGEGAIKMAMSRLLQKMKARWEVQHE